MPDPAPEREPRRGERDHQDQQPRVDHRRGEGVQPAERDQPDEQEGRGDRDQHPEERQREPGEAQRIDRQHALLVRVRDARRADHRGDPAEAGPERRDRTAERQPERQLGGGEGRAPEEDRLHHRLRGAPSSPAGTSLAAAAARRRLSARLTG